MPPHEKPCSQTKGGLQFLTPADTKVTQFLLNLLDPMAIPIFLYQ